MVNRGMKRTILVQLLITPDNALYKKEINSLRSAPAELKNNVVAEETRFCLGWVQHSNLLATLANMYTKKRLASHSYYCIEFVK